MLPRRAPRPARPEKLHAMDAEGFACSYAFAFALLGCTVRSVTHFNNGIPADQLVSAAWRKSRISNPSSTCVEVAELPDGAVAVRNSRHLAGPALIYTQAEITAFLTGLKNGEFDTCARTRWPVALLPLKSLIVS